MTDASSVPVPESRNAEREYILFELHAAPSVASWVEVHRVDARNTREALLKIDDPDGEYVAVPARYWKPIAVHTRTVSKVVVGS